MSFDLNFTRRALETIAALEGNPSELRRFRKLEKTLALLQANPRHPGLNAHRYQTKRSPEGKPIWEVYVENRTPSAWRIWFMYGPGAETIAIVAIGPHPD